MLQGKKQNSEKIILKTSKLIQKTLKEKNFEAILKLALVKISPVFNLKKIKRKRRALIEIPFLLNYTLKLFYGIKFIKNSCKIKKSFIFFKMLAHELINTTLNQSKSFIMKKELHKRSFLKKKFANFKWF